ncbi:unnamed protein product, partial [Discosporangium mesarthrocarpum]
RGGVELRRPREDPIPQEDLHKFIWDGKEFGRAPNVFDVGGELKLLPEVFSDLDFGPRKFVDNGTPQEQKELRDSRPWGRVYVDGWPAPMQYMRSHFGGPAPGGIRPMILAGPLDACEPLTNSYQTDEVPPVIVAVRGTCTFSTKVNNTEQAGASGLLIVNNEEGLLHPPGPDGKDLATFSAMIPAAEGGALVEVMGRPGEKTSGMIVPMNCHENSGLGKKNELCLPATQVDRKAVDEMAKGGFLSWPSGGKYEYLLAQFGSKVPVVDLELGGALPNGEGQC